MRGEGEGGRDRDRDRENTGKDPEKMKKPTACFGVSTYCICCGHGGTLLFRIIDSFLELLTHEGGASKELTLGFI